MSPISSTKVKITWTTDAANAGYVVNAYLEGNIYVPKFSSIGMETKGEKLLDLTPDDEGEYTFYVREVNALGKTSAYN